MVGITSSVGQEDQVSGGAGRQKGILSSPLGLWRWCGGPSGTTYKARTGTLTQKSWPGVSHKPCSCMHVYVCQRIVCVFWAKLIQMFFAIGLRWQCHSLDCVSFGVCGSGGGSASGPSMDEGNTRWTHMGTVDATSAHKWRPNISLYYS